MSETDYNFANQPRDDDFEKVFYATKYAKTDASLAAQLIATEKAAKKAIEFAKRYPNKSTACKLSFSIQDNWVVPVSATMHTLEAVYKMNRLAKYGEALFVAGRQFGEEKEFDCYDDDYRTAVCEIGTAVPDAIRRLNNGFEKNDFNTIHGVLIELYITALNQMEDLYGAGLKITTIAYGQADDDDETDDCDDQPLKPALEGLDGLLHRAHPRRNTQLTPAG